MIDPNDEQIIRPRELVIGGAFVAIVVAFIAVVLVIHGFSEQGNGSGLPTPSPSPSPQPTGTAAASASQSGTGAFSPGSTAEERLVELARDSIEFLPAGRWPELYDDFVRSFQDRCTREAFAQAGEDGAAAVGSNLSLLRFVRLENLVTTGDAATGTIVGEVRGQSQYTVVVAYGMEDGVWKLAASVGTSGCSAFNRTSG
jgi:hypothetical protein